MPKSSKEMSLTQQIIKDVESLHITQGEHAGKPMFVMPWENEIIEAMVSHRRLAFSIARSNGKTSFIAALACSAIRPDGALFVPRGEILLVASSLRQAGVGFSHILHFLRPWTEDRKGKLKRDEWRIVDNSHEKNIEHRPTGTLLTAIGSDHKRAHGRAPRFAILDEPAQWVGGGEMLYNAIRTGMGKQVDPKLFVIGTQSDQHNHWFQRLLRSPTSSTWTKVYASEKGDDDFSEETIKKANPSYEYIETLRNEIQTSIDDVKSGALTIHAYRAYHLNTGTPETEGREVLIPVNNWEMVSVDDPSPRDGPVAIGVDLGGGTSMSAIAFYWPETGRLETYAAYPRIPTLMERGKADGVDELYQNMFERGEITIAGEYQTDNVEFLKMFLPVADQYERLGITADAYGKVQIRQVLYELGKDPEKEIDLRRVGRGPHGKEDVDAFRSEVLTGHLSTAKNLCLDYGISRSIVHRDANGNPALDKSGHRGRIDVVQASILAVGMGYRWRKPYESDGVSGIHKDMVDSGMSLVESI